MLHLSPPYLLLCLSTAPFSEKSIVSQWREKGGDKGRLECIDVIYTREDKHILVHFFGYIIS